MEKYNWNAKDYEKNSQAQLKWARELISKLNLTGNEAVLDVGCGDGKVTVEIANSLSNGSIIGIDNSEGMIELAQKQYPPEKYPNVSFQFMDAAALRFNDQFDVIFSNAALHWVKNHRPVLAEFARSLKTGGRVLLQMGGKGNAQGILSVIDMLRNKPEWNPFFTHFEFPYGFHGIEEYNEWLKAAGLIAERVELIPKDMAQDVEGLKGWIRTTWLPFTSRVPEECRDKFIEEIVTEYIRRTPLDAAGKTHVAMVRLEVAANKIG